jgi:(E)-4-hydroxy-3-methylbut-2-enyl-diphosphate synthase
MPAINLGMPAAPAPVLAPRKPTRRINVGKVAVGGGAPVSVQSMTTTKTTDINGTLQQIAQLTAAGCDIVRVAVPSQDDADVLHIIAKKSQIPVIADIHFQPKYVFAAIDAGCAAVRVNPGNIKQFDDKVGEIAKAATDAGVSLRIGVNAGSLDKRLLAKYGGPTPEALVESALWEASLFEEHGFRDFKISVKHNDPIVMVQAYRQLSAACDYPLHLGVTEAGPAFQGTIKSATAFGILLSRGHRGHDPRLAVGAARGGGQGRSEDPRVAEPQAAAAGDRLLPRLRPRSGGRLGAGQRRHRRARRAEAPLRVAVMGCVVNGPGEAREADLGVAAGNGKGQIFVKGEVIKTVPESEIVATLIEEANRLAADMEHTGEAPQVTVV